MSDPVLGALISTFGVIFTALLSTIGVLANRTRQHAKAAKEQVKNTHTANLRDDLDEKHEEVLAAFGQLSIQVVTLDRRLTAVETTQPRRSRFEPKGRHAHDR